MTTITDQITAITQAISEVAISTSTQPIQSTETPQELFIERIQNDQIQEAIAIYQTLSQDQQGAIVQEAVASFIKKLQFSIAFRLSKISIEANEIVGKALQESFKDQNSCDTAFGQMPNGVLKLLSNHNLQKALEVLKDFISRLEKNGHIIEGIYKFCEKNAAYHNIEDVITCLCELPQFYLHPVLKKISPALAASTLIDKYSHENIIQICLRGSRKALSLIPEIIDILHISQVGVLLSEKGTETYKYVYQELGLFHSTIQKKICAKIEMYLLHKAYKIVQPFLSSAYANHIIDDVIKIFGDMGKQHATANELKLVVERYKQLDQLYASGYLEKSSLNQANILKIAMMIELDIKKITEKAHDILFRHVTKLYSDIEVNWKKKSIYLISGAVIAGGTSKAARYAARIAFDSFDKSLILLRLVTRVHMQMLTKRPEEYIEYNRTVCKAMRKEINFLDFFKNDGFPVVESFYEFEQSYAIDSKKTITLPRVSYYTTAYKNFKAVIGQRNYFTILEKWQLATSLIRRVAKIHDRNCIHGDLKPENIVYDPKPSSMVAFPIDFGLTFSSIELSNTPAPSYALGYYGSFWWTAPELFGVKNFKEDHFKVEMFAVGVVLYELYYGVMPTWKDLIHKCSRTPELPAADLLKAQDDVKKQIVDFQKRGDLLDTTYNILRLGQEIGQSATQSMNIDEQYRLLMHKLLMAAPEQRLGANEAVQLIEFFEKINKK